MFDRIKSTLRKVFHRIGASAAIMLRGEHYDNATTTVENERHWAPAKDLPPITINNPHARRKLRERARYEEDNNCYAAGIVTTLASDCVGYVAPIPQVIHEDAELCSYIETAWKDWSESPVVNLPEKLHVMDRGRRTDGESFVSFISDHDETLRETGLALNVIIVPQSRVTSPYNYAVIEDREVEDENGNFYSIKLINDDGVIVNSLTGQPHEFKVTNVIDEVYGYTGSVGVNVATVSARYMKQWFRPKRAGQFRGICELAPSLGMFAQLRRYGLATLSSAEIAAMLTVVLKTTLPAEDATGPSPLQPFSARHIERNMVTAMPDGWDIAQLKPEQPVTHYGIFVDTVLREIGRSLNMPFGIVAGDHSKYNYSSGRLDVIGYDEEKKYERKELCVRILNPLFYEFLLELSLQNHPLSKKLKQALKDFTLSYNWQFTNRPSIAPDVDSKVDDERLKNGTITLSEVYTARGMDYREQLAQIAKEKQEKIKLGIDNPIISDTINGKDATNVQPNVDPVDSTNPAKVDPIKPAVDVAASALNGAQISSLLLIVDKLAMGMYPPESVKQLIASSFPTFKPEDIDKIVNSFAGKVPQNPPTVAA